MDYNSNLTVRESDYFVTYVTTQSWTQAEKETNISDDIVGHFIYDGWLDGWIDDLEDQRRRMRGAVVKGLKFWKIDVVVHIALFLLNAACVVLTLLFCTGFMQMILLMKTFTLALKCIYQSIYSAILFNHLDPHNDIRFSGFNIGLEWIYRSLEDIFGGYHQFQTFFLHVELNALICKMERQENSILRFIKIEVIAMMLVIIVVFANEGAKHLLVYFFMGFTYLKVVEAIIPFFYILIIGLCVATLYYSYQIVTALRNSRNFRRQCGLQEQNRDHDFLTAVLMTTAFFEVVHVVLHFAKSITHSVYDFKLYQCMMETKSLEEGTDCILDKSSLISMHENSYQEIFMRSTGPQCLETVIINFLLLGKRFLLKD